MAADYSVQVLGGLSIMNSEGELIEISSRKAEAIVVYILFSDKASVEREEIATLLWGEMSETRALTNLRVTLAAIKKQCRDLLIISRRRISLNPDIVIESDRSKLEATIDTSLANGLDKKELSLEQARAVSEKMTLYRGDFLQGFFIRKAIAFEDWAAYEREYLRRRIIDVSQMLIPAYRRNNLLHEAIQSANQLVHIDSFNDAAYQWLIELYALNGQREKSLETYRDYKQLLAEEIGVEPTEEVAALAAAVRDGSLAPETPAVKVVEKSALPVPNNIPMELSPFFGRRTELAQLRDYLHNPHMRLVTMIGQGGTGKTRLAIEAAHQNIRLFPDGVWFIKLESVVSADLMLPEIYKVLGITYPQRERAQDELVAYLNGHHILMVLDNFEHLLDASAVISDVIQRTENSKVIVTSREMTGLPEETNMFLDGLAGRQGDDDPENITIKNLSVAGKMFLERTRRIKPGFEPKEKDVVLIEEICDQVARLPLGIELAAAGLKTRTLQALHDHISEDIMLLKSDQPELPERQRSLLSVFNTFWEQLAEDEQLLISRLSTFCGVVTRDAARQVAGVSVFFLSSLVSRGFLKRVGAYGYRAHSMHRQFVRKKLKENPREFMEVSEKHRDYYFNMLQRIVRSLRDSPQKGMLDELEEEMCNIRSALHFTIDKGEKQKGLAFCELLMPFWKIRGYYQEGYHWLDQVFALEGETNPVMESSALCAAAKLVSVLGDHETAESYSRKSLRIATDTGDQHGIARALNSLGASLAERGEAEKAEEIYNESLEIYRNLRVQQAIAGTLVNLANMEIKSGDNATASGMLGEAEKSFNLVGDSVGVTHVLLAQARIALVEKQTKKSLKILHDALEKAWGLSAREELTQLYVMLAQAHAQLKSWEVCVQWLALARMAVRRYKLPLSASEERVEKDVQAQAKEALGEKAFQSAWREGELAGEAKVVQDALSPGK